MDLRISNLMDRKHPSVQLGSLVSYARALMRSSGVRLLPVLDGDRLVGVLTRIEVLRITATRSNALVREVMDYPRITLSPNDDVRDAASKLIEADEWYAPVVGGGMEYLGVFGLEHFIAYALDMQLRGGLEPVESYMDEVLSYVYSDDPLSKVWYKMLRYRYLGLPVFERESGRLIGVVTQVDLLRRGFARPQFESESGPRSGPRVSDVMSTPPITVSPRSTVREAAELMIGRNIGRLVVVRGDEVVGLINRRGVTKAYLKYEFS